MVLIDKYKYESERSLRMAINEFMDIKLEDDRIRTLLFWKRITLRRW